MHDADFSEAALPPLVYVLGLELKPYSIGHELILRRERNPFVSEKTLYPKLGAEAQVSRAVMVCAHSWREWQRARRDPFWSLKLAIWNWRIRHSDFLQAIADFLEYRSVGTTYPPCGEVDGSESARRLGAPYLARLIQFLTREFHKSEEQALDYQLGLAQWHYAVFQEHEGNLKIFNEAEIEFETWCQEQDRLSAASPSKEEGQCPA